MRVGVQGGFGEGAGCDAEAHEADDEGGFAVEGGGEVGGGDRVVLGHGFESFDVDEEAQNCGGGDLLQAVEEGIVAVLEFEEKVLCSCQGFDASGIVGRVAEILRR